MGILDKKNTVTLVIDNTGSGVEIKDLSYEEAIRLQNIIEARIESGCKTVKLDQINDKVVLLATDKIISVKIE